MRRNPAPWRPVPVLPSLRSLKFSVATATFGVGLLYLFLLPRLDVAQAPELARMAVSAGAWWFGAILACSACVGWLSRPAASPAAARSACVLLQLMLALDTVMVGLALAGFYAAIIAVPGGVA